MTCSSGCGPKSKHWFSLLQPKRPDSAVSGLECSQWSKQSLSILLHSLRQ